MNGTSSGSRGGDSAGEVRDSWQLLRSVGGRRQPSGGFSFSDEDVAKRRLARLRNVHTWQVPLFRLAGMSLLVLACWTFELVGSSASGGPLLVDAATFTAVLALYVAVSWATLYRFYHPDRRFDLALTWQLADFVAVLFFLVAVDGLGEWLALLVALRASDQADEGPARTSLFVAVGLSLYLATAAWFDANVRPLPFERIALVASGILLVGCYTVLRSRSSRYLRDRTRSAVRAARTLVRRLEERGRELEEQTELLRDERARAEQANASKNTFLANVSHEIRTPLNGIVGMVDLLYDTRIDREQRGYLSTLRGSAQALLTLLNDILDLTKIEAGKLQTERIEFSLRDLVSDVTAASSTAAKKGVQVRSHFDPGAPERVYGDPARLRQVLTNLISNALKFTAEGSVDVRVSARGEHARIRRVRFEVRDTGIGIEPDKLDEVFEAFVQADASTTRRFGGTGLGLAICRQLIQLMGGELGAESAPGEGSTFWFHVPLEVSDKRPSRDTTGSLPLRMRRVTALTAAEPEVVESRLRAWGVSITVASEAGKLSEAIERAADRERPYELLMVDAERLAEVVPRLRAGSALARLPLLVLTPGPPDEDQRRRALAAGARGLLPRTLQEFELAHALRLLLDEPSELLLDHDRLQQAMPRHRVLLVEDNRINQQVARRHLEKGGYEVVVASDGRAAIERFAEDGRFDVVLMDLQMPEIDGFEATRRIRDLPGGARVPIVAVTAHALKGDRESVLAAGLDDYLAKPITPHDLYEVIERNVGAPVRLEPLFELPRRRDPPG
ncbi:MAG: response regulator [Acidobacteria bacterium]|nr:MAG: response regulator [Acidobacteriota bacterium]REJ99500.1 MAG: response regulator [Acidobacteriota bacterium]